ncbi:uncharacterized protein LOC119740462 isoform X2 [Patiria miniata]|uniref:Beta-hexosaminidase bacterial type N-terminal domain-containing protein n=1 Tax=Patiria miniata TaxID=46514 RepID=A0A914B658_PATMI|nr:uncharacterized protein LOC119740462 isoform X2 [Patiria miniata]
MDKKSAETHQNLRVAVEKGRTDILRAVIGGNTNMTNEVKESKRDSQLETVLNNITPGQGTMLHLASKLGNADVVRALLISGADPSVLDEEGITAYDSSFSEQVTKVYHDVLLQAVAQSNMALARNLLKAGVDVNIQDDEATGNTALHWAASYGSKDTVKLLIDDKADINAANVDGATPLHDAVARGDVGIIYELVSNGANRYAKAKKGKFAGKTPMSMAENRPKVKKAMEGVQLANGDVKHAETAAAATKPVSPLTPLTPVPDADIQQQLSDLLNAQKLAGRSQPSPVTDEKFQLLWPKPQSMIKKSGDPLKLKPHFLVRVAAGPTANSDYLQQMVDIWSIHGPLLGEMGFKCILECAVRPEYPDPFILCQYVPNLFTGKDQYRITVTEKQMTVQCADFSGLWNASCTVVQLIRLFNEEGIPAVQISDWPDLRYRGVALDISCGRVPKLDYLMHVVNILTLMKFNELHLHMKSVEGEEVEGVMPYSESELLDLEIYCRWRYMDVIPHLDISSKTELTPKQMGIFKQVLTSFGSTSSVNIGATLTKKLLATPSDDDQDGKDSSHLAQLDVRDRLHLLGVKDSHNVRFCANTVDISAETIARLPVGSMAMHYGCKVDYDYSAACTALTEAGVAFSVCPGTAAWDSIVGCPEAAIRNIHNAVLSAAASPNAVGLLLTDWSGTMQINQPTISFPGFATAGGLAWNKNVPLDFITSRLADIINHYFFMDEDCVLGQVIVELGRAETFITRSAWNMLEGQLANIPNPKGSFLCQLISKPDEVDLEHVTPDVIQKTLNHLHKIQRSLESAKKTPVQEFAIVELQLATDIMLWASRVARILVVAGKKPDAASAGSDIVNVGLANANMTAKTDSANKLLSIIDMYRKVWLHTNHTSGLLECLEVFNHILEKLIPTDVEGLQNGDVEEK